MKDEKKVEKGRKKNTQERIHEAARKEFSSKGLSGARVAAIAKSAKVNIRMIYYFFGSKAKLLEAVLSRIFQRRQAQLLYHYDSVGDLLTAYFDSYSEDPESVRLLQWEALQTPLNAGSRLTNFDDRQEVITRRIDAIAELQAKGDIPSELDPKLLYLAFVALSIYPMAFPQTVFIATGDRPASADFKDDYRETLRTIGDQLFPSATAKGG